MNYEKEYKEMKARVLEIGRGYVKGVDFSKPRQIAEYIDPELKESEDEKIRKGIVKYLEQSQFGEEHYCVDDDIVRDYIAWLEKQGEQEPTEIDKNSDMVEALRKEYEKGRADAIAEMKPTWSEEDEKVREKLISYFDSFDESTSFSVYEIFEIRQWLKSLKPQNRWKPSDEQLRPLGYAIDYFKKKKNDTTYLESLYNDLKKL